MSRRSKPSPSADPRRARSRRRPAAAALALRRRQRAQEPPPVEQIVIGGVDPALRGPRVRAAAGRTRRARPPAARSPRCCATTCASRASSSSCPTSLLSAIPPLNPDAPELRGLEGHRRQDPGGHARRCRRGRADRRGRASSSSTPGRPCWPAATPASADNPRVFAHQASDDIMTLTQYRGVARTRIAFVSDRDATEGAPVEGALHRRLRRLQPAAGDGERLAQHPARLETRTGRSLAYVSYRQGSPALYLASIFEGAERSNLTGQRGTPGLRPHVSPDGKRLAFASNRGGQHGHLGRERRRQRRPAAHHDPGLGHRARAGARPGRRSRSPPAAAGTPQIYLMDSEGLNVRRLTTVGNWNDACAWNPSKQYSEIAYTVAPRGGGFDIAVVDLATRQVRQVTQGRGQLRVPRLGPERPPPRLRVQPRGHAGRSRSPTGRADHCRPWPPGRATTPSRTGARDVDSLEERFMPFRFDRRLTGLVLTLAVLALLPAAAKAPARAGLDPRGAQPGRTRGNARARACPAARGGARRARGARRGRRGNGHRRKRPRVRRGRAAQRHPLRATTAQLGDEARATLEKHAAWLQAHRSTASSSRATATSAAPSSTTWRWATSARARRGTTW